MRTHDQPRSRWFGRALHEDDPDIGFYNALEAARRNGVKRFLVATSNHAVGFYRCDQTVDHQVYPKPDSRYGVSKVFNEALASLYADRYGMQMFCMRIGNVNHALIMRIALGR